MTANTESKRDLHSLLSASFYLPEETLLAADRSASCHLMMSDSFMSQSAVKGGGLRDRQGTEREQAGEREKKNTGTPTRTCMDVTVATELEHAWDSIYPKKKHTNSRWPTRECFLCLRNERKTL